MPLQFANLTPSIGGFGLRRRVLNDCFIMSSLAVTSQIVGHGKSAGNRVTGMATHTNIVVVQIPHHH